MLWAEQAQITDLFNKGKLTSHKTGKGQNQESIQVQSNKNRKKKKRGKTRGKRHDEHNIQTKTEESYKNRVGVSGTLSPTVVPKCIQKKNNVEDIQTTNL